MAHPGDGEVHRVARHSEVLTILNIVQRVRAIGKPPAGMFCLFAHMKNVVVLPSVGK